MSRRGPGAKRGPDLSWDDDDDTPSTPQTNKPDALFPPMTLPTPRPIQPSELAAAKFYLSYRERIRSGPLYAVLDPASLTDDKGKVSKRAGFDPFNDQDTYSSKYHRKKRTVPDLSGREYRLDYFPRELWDVLDPKRRSHLWSAEEKKSRGLKRKRDLGETYKQEDDREGGGDRDAEDDEDDDDVVVSSARRKARERKERKKDGEKSGMEAEDEYPDEVVEDDDDGDGGGSEDDVDDEFEEGDDEENDDYNAEKYFSGGEGDDDYGGGDDEGGVM